FQLPRDGRVRGGGVFRTAADLRAVEGRELIHQRVQPLRHRCIPRAAERRNSAAAATPMSDELPETDKAAAVCCNSWDGLCAPTPPARRALIEVDLVGVRDAPVVLGVCELALVQLVREVLQPGAERRGDGVRLVAVTPLDQHASWLLGVRAEVEE